MSATPPVSLEEARRRLKELGYLDGRVERFLFRRAFEGRGGLFLPAILLGAFGAALAAVAAVDAADPEIGRSVPSFLVLFGHLFAASLLPAGALAGLAAAVADRARRPAAAALAAGLLTGGLVVGLWIAGSRDLGANWLHGLVWGVPVSAAAVLAARGARSGVLARAYAHAHRLPEARRHRVFLAVAATGLLVGALVFALRPQPEAARPPQPASRLDEVRVIAIDGLGLDDPKGPASRRLRERLSRAATGWWVLPQGSPPEIWTTLAAGVEPARHGVRALDRVRPLGGSLAVRPPLGMRWYLRGLGPTLGLVARAPVSVRDRRSLDFWEVYASAGLASVSVGWWASGPWPGARVFGNEDVLAQAGSGLEVDRIALGLLKEARDSWGGSLSTVYLPSLDITRNDKTARSEAAANVEMFLADQIDHAESDMHAFVLVVLLADSHPSPAGLGRMIVFDRGAPQARRIHIRPEDVAPSILARAGIPVATDLPGRPVVSLFEPGRLDTSTVPTYGPRLAPVVIRRGTDREYLEKLKSLGYLN